MSDAIRIRDIEDEKARRRAARELVSRYHEEELRRLLEHVRQGFEQLDRGELDPFDLDDLIHRYKRSAQKLWSFCGSGGSAWEDAALTVEWWREHGEQEQDWWAAGEPRRAEAETGDRPGKGPAQRGLRTARPERFELPSFGSVDRATHPGKTLVRTTSAPGTGAFVSARGRLGHIVSG